MLSAYQDSELIAAWEVEPEERDHAFYTCPKCFDPVIARCGVDIAWHFAHKPGAECERAHEYESVEHLRAKTQIARAMHVAGYKAEIEAQVGRRRVDLLVRSRVTGRWVAVEVQTSRIAIPDLKRRNRVDRTAGAMGTLWIWVNRIPITASGNVQLPDDVRYEWNRTWTSLSVLRGGELELALVERTPAQLCQECEVMTRSTTCRRCGKWLGWPNRNYVGIEYLPAEPVIVVAEGRFGPTLRLKAQPPAVESQVTELDAASGERRGSLEDEEAVA